MDLGQLRENKRTWERIAESFDRTRNKPWSPVVAFLDEVPSGATVLDAGSGNGRHTAVAAERDRRVVALDVAKALLGRTRAKSPGAHLVQGALEALPLGPARFDAVLCVAVLHHVRGVESRVQALQRMVRVLRPEGRLLVSVWARDQTRFGPDNPPTRPTHGAVEEGDAMVRWTQHGLDEERFIHLYGWSEWLRELGKVDARVERAWPVALSTVDEPDNFFAILRPT